MPEPSQRRAIIVHGGAWDIPKRLHAEHVTGCRAAAAAGWDILGGGGTAIQAGAAACTGVGEQITKTVLAQTALDQIALLRSAKDAARVAIAYFEHRVAGQGGVICISPDGQVGFAHTTPYLAHAYRNADISEIKAAMRVGG